MKKIKEICAEIIIAKNPLGDTRTLKIRFDREYVSFLK